MSCTAFVLVRVSTPALPAGSRREHGIAGELQAAIVRHRAWSVGGGLAVDDAALYVEQVHEAGYRHSRRRRASRRAMRCGRRVGGRRAITRIGRRRPAGLVRRRRRPGADVRAARGAGSHPTAGARRRGPGGGIPARRRDRRSRGAPAMVTIAGPDSHGDADAVALTFARRVAPVKKQGPLVPIGGDFYRGGDGWMAR